MHEAGSNIPILAMTFDNSNLDDIFFKIRLNAIQSNLKIEFEAFRYNLAGNDADSTCFPLLE